MKKIGTVTLVAGVRCDQCQAEEPMNEYYVDGSVSPQGWTKYYGASAKGFTVRHDACPKCSEAAA